MDRDFVFCRPDLAMASPLVSVSWPGAVVDLLNRLPDGAGGNMPEGWCVDFVVGCCGLPEVGRGGVQLWNWRPREEFDDRGLSDSSPEYAAAFLAWLGEQIEIGGKEPPILINTWLPPVAYQGGVELCRMVVDADRERPAVWVAASPAR